MPSHLYMTFVSVCTNCGMRYWCYTDRTAPLTKGFELQLVDACSVCYPRPTRKRGPFAALPSYVAEGDESDVGADATK